jgi:tetraacyldisaccharide 4'-kinase
MARPLLLPLSYVYGAGVVIRNWLFDKGWLRSWSVSAPVISVGNLSSGGVGKTPLVEFLARRLTQKGKKVAIVSRGYKRKTRGMVVVSNGLTKCAQATDSGDEPAQMASKLTGVVVIVDEKRVRGALYAIQKFGVNLIILDDGFQHRYLRRDVDIVVLPVQEVSNPGWMLPGGNRREPISSLRRATIIGVSRCENLDQFLEAKASIRRWTDKEVMGLAIKVSSFRRASTGFSVDLGGLKGKSAVAFSGIGNPAAFEQTLRSLGLNLKSHSVFSDHHPYSDSELAKLEEAVRSQGADFLVTTEKDVARINTGEADRTAFLGRAPLFYVEIEQSVIQEESALNQLIDRL